VSELEHELATTADQIAFPATLPVLPLKETVVFPDSLTPLAIGQERSIKLIDDVVAGDRMLALVTVRDSARRRRRAGGDQRAALEARRAEPA